MILLLHLRFLGGSAEPSAPLVTAELFEDLELLQTLLKLLEGGIRGCGRGEGANELGL